MAVEIQNCQMAIALVLSYNMLAEEAMWTRTASFQILVEAGEPIAGQVILVFKTLCSQSLMQQFSPCF